MQNKTSEFIEESDEKKKDTSIVYDDVYLIASRNLSAPGGIKKFSYDEKNKLNIKEILVSFKEMKEFKINILTEQMAQQHDANSENWSFIMDKKGGNNYEGVQHEKDIYNDVCKKRQNTQGCYIIDPEDKATDEFLRKIGVEFTNKAQIINFKAKNNQGHPIRYVLSQYEFKQDLETFFDKCVSGEWPEQIRSEPQHSINWEEDIVKVTARTFGLMKNHDEEEDVLLYIYSENCSFCKTFETVYKEAAR